MTKFYNGEGDNYWSFEIELYLIFVLRTWKFYPHSLCGLISGICAMYLSFAKV